MAILHDGAEEKSLSGDLEWVLLDPKDLHLAPNSAGVYRFYNKKKEIIYVGKSKQLVKRLASYFQTSNKLTEKTRRLVQETKQIGCVALDTEYDALLLENTLIKRHQPKYNILLRDDKTYPYLCLSYDRFPRLFSTRKIIAHQGQYFGPYTDLRTMHALKDVLNKMLQLRTCRHALSLRNVARKRYTVCLDYHLGHCQGPCEGLQEEQAYEKNVSEARAVLRGKWSTVRKRLQEDLTVAVHNMRFEEANGLKKKLLAIEQFQGKAVVVNLDMQEVEVCTLIHQNKIMYANYMRVENGMVIMSDAFKIVPKVEESTEEVFLLVLAHARKKHKLQASTVLSNITLQEWGRNLPVLQPKIGPKRKLIDISIRNAYMASEQNNTKIPTQRSAKVLRQVQRALRLQHAPVHIECFDISNLGGEYVVGAMTCFKNAKPDKSSYRYFNTQVQGKANDYQAIEEVITRRYSRMLQEKQPLPQLIIVDGGKGQLSKAYNALKTLHISVEVIGLAKRLEEVFLPGQSDSLPLHKQSDASLLLQKIRNETHRFVIEFHRKKRLKGSFSSVLDEIKGIGPISKTRLLKAYTSIKAMQEAPKEELRQYINTKQIQLLKDHIQKDTTEKT